MSLFTGLSGMVLMFEVVKTVEMNFINAFTVELISFELKLLSKE